MVDSHNMNKSDFFMGHIKRLKGNWRSINFARTNYNCRKNDFNTTSEEDYFNIK